MVNRRCLLQVEKESKSHLSVFAAQRQGGYDKNLSDLELQAAVSSGQAGCAETVEVIKILG